MAIIYYKQKCSLFGKDDIRQEKSIVFIVPLKQNKFQKLKKLKEVLLEPSCFGIR